MFSSRICYLLSCSLFLVIEVGVCFDLRGIDLGQKGPLAWDMKFKRVENCKDRGAELVDVDVRLKRISRTKVVMEGNITYKIDYGDNIKIVSDLSTWGNGGWKCNAYRFTIKNGCSDYSVLEVFLKEMKRKAGIPLSCPIRKGTYELKDLDTGVINNISMPVYTIPTLWKLSLLHYNKTDNKLLDCKVFILESKVKQLKKQQDNKKSEKT